MNPEEAQEAFRAGRDVESVTASEDEFRWLQEARKFWLQPQDGPANGDPPEPWAAS